MATRRTLCTRAGCCSRVVKVRARASPSSWFRSVGPFSWLRIATAALSCSPVPSPCSMPLCSHTISRAHICTTSWGCVHASWCCGLSAYCVGVHSVGGCIGNSPTCRLGVVDSVVATCTCPPILVNSFPSSVPHSIFGRCVWWVA